MSDDKDLEQQKETSTPDVEVAESSAEQAHDENTPAPHTPFALEHPPTPPPPPEPRRAEQIVLAGHQDGPQQVKWAITKLR